MKKLKNVFGVAIFSSFLVLGILSFDLVFALSAKPFKAQPTLDPVYQNYRSEHQDQLMIYQGDLWDLGRSVTEVAQAMKPFDHIVLTNAFASLPQWKNGSCLLGDFKPGSDGRALPELIKTLREQNPSVKIYGYISSTADNPVGCWDNSPESQNYLCPGDTCDDAILYIQKWREAELKYGKDSSLDGFFVDLFNVFYAHEITLRNISSFIHSLENSAGNPYKIIANTSATDASYYHPKPSGPLTLAWADPMTIAADILRPGDSIFVEGLSLKAGQVNPKGIEVYNKLKDIYRQKNITWMASDTEKVYVDPESGNNCSVFPGDAASISTFCVDDPAFSWLTSPSVCSTPNQTWTYYNFRYHAPEGGIGYIYNEAGLGTFSKVIPFCPHSL